MREPALVKVDNYLDSEYLKPKSITETRFKLLTWYWGRYWFWSNIIGALVKDPTKSRGGMVSLVAQVTGHWRLVKHADSQASVQPAGSDSAFTWSPGSLYTVHTLSITDRENRST
jgi:hypothetical protein